MRRLPILLAVLVVAGAAIVLAGVGQGDPPASPGGKPSAQALAAEKARIAKGSHGVDVGRKLFVSEGCSSCHTVTSAGETGKLGPRLDVILKGAPRKVIETYIVDPKDTKVPGYDNNLMRRDYKTRLDGGELRALVSYLHAAAG